MPDVPVGAVPAPATPAAPPKHPVVVAREARAAKLAQVSAGLAKLSAESTPPSSNAAEKPTEQHVEKPVEGDKLAGDAPNDQDAKSDKEPDKTEAPKPDAPKPDEPTDPQTAKALAAIDKQAKKFREEQAAARREFEQEMAEQRAELARMKAEFSAKASSFEDLKKLAKRDPVAVLRKLGIESEDEWELVGRAAFPLTKAGKADPRHAELAARAQKDLSHDSELAELRKMVSDLTEQISTQNKQAEVRSYVERWSSDAVKAIPSDRKTLIGNLHAKAPDKAKQALLAIGAQLERNSGETPSYEDVIAEFERQERAELEARGVDVDALLRPAASAATKPSPAPSKTLDLTAPATGTRPINGTQTKAERIAAISAGLKKLQAEA